MPTGPLSGSWSQSRSSYWFGSPSSATSACFSRPSSAVVIFGATTLFHFVGGWTLLALSQQTIGVARTGALVSSAPIIGTLVAAIALDEPLTLVSTEGVLLAVVGVALISLSSGSEEWRRPWFGLADPHTRAMAPHWLPIEG
jgi:drug/metabolite transporter (DMT)-like permease